jgi:ADP-heptose:LPS heptosyltransferase
MKILVISLLRLGDIMMCTPVLKGLREQNPTAEIHVLINSQFKGIVPLIPYVSQFKYFERSELQKGLGEVDRGVFESYERLRLQIQDLQNEKYDQVINLTQTKLSGWIVKSLKAPENLGLSFDSQGRALYGSSWFEYLNRQAEAEGEEIFHYIDIFKYAAGVRNPLVGITLCETEEGRAEADLIAQDEPNLVLVQALTNDSKKDWGLGRFAQALALFAQKYPQASILILGSPAEKSRLTELVENLKAREVSARLAICSLEGALSLLKRARVLLTGDTSIKHLASAARTPVIELSIGSSDYRRTGSYLQGSLILQSREVCAPCVHSSPCHREAQFCATRISAECVALVLSEVFSGTQHQLKTIAEEFKEEVEILRTETRASGFWTSYSVLEPMTEAAVGRWLDMCSWKIYLQSRARDNSILSEFGTETAKLAALLQTIYPGVSQTEWMHLYGEMERTAESIQTRVCAFQTGLNALKTSYDNPKRMQAFVKSLIAFREKLKSSPFLKSYKMALDLVIEDDITPPFVRFRKMIDALHEIHSRTQIEIKVIRTLQAQNEASA